MKLKIALIVASIVFVVAALTNYYTSDHGYDGKQGLGSVRAWQHMANPGKLSSAHAFLDHNCSACHTAVAGVEAANCTVCHANDESILQRQPTAFHADIGNCKDCHSEHQGRHAEMSNMDHQIFAEISRKNLEKSAKDDTESSVLLSWLEHAGSGNATGPSLAYVHPALSGAERTLNCASCHQSDDRHFGFFGNDCASCHETKKWSLPQFRHPSPSSHDCAQCHQAPPSHYMMHFKMISAKVAGKPHAKVSACYSCHQTTSWPDIKGVGWYKHH